MATIETLASFNDSDGNVPTGLRIDADGNLFGTTRTGGANAGPYGTGDGTLFEIPLTASGYASTPDTLVSFTDNEGIEPFGNVLIDGNGNLFGTLPSSGPNGGGTVYEVADTPTGYAAAPTILASFSAGASDINFPTGSLIADAQGDLIGTADGGGVAGDGVVFEIAKTATGYASTPTLLASLDGATDGMAFTTTGLIADANGNLFGETVEGGESHTGTIFEIARTSTGYASTPIVLAPFKGTSSSGLTIDPQGDLFGITQPDFDQSGFMIDDGSVFEIAKTATGYASTPTTLVSFQDASPGGTLLIDAAGNLWGTDDNGSSTQGDTGSLFEIVKTSSGYATTPTVIADVPGSQGSLTDLVADAKGDLFATATTDANDGNATVIEITGSGFVTCFCPGTRILTTRGEVAVEELTTDDAIVLAEPDAPALPLRWLGRQTIATRFADPMRVAPIRIRAGALSENQPHRDLRVSPDHAFLVDGVFAQAGALVNGVSVVREDANLPEFIVYFHVELPRHALLLAEGAAAESFIDNVDRLAFDNWDAHEALDETSEPLREMAHPRAKSHRQVPRALRESLLARARTICGDGVAAAA